MSRSKLKTICKFLVFSLAMIVLVLQGCATTKPSSIDPLAYKARAKSSVDGDVAVTVAVPTIAESRAIYGVNLASKDIQPVWVEVKNDSKDAYWFLPSGLDPEYFSTAEAAFAFSKNKKQIYRQLDAKFKKLQFQNPIQGGATEAGFVLVNLDEGFKAVDIDLLSRREIKSFSFIFADPEFKADYKEIDSESLYSTEDIINIENEEELRRVLEELPCCTANSSGNKTGDPLNLVLIGEVNDIIPALIRRNWHATEIVWSRAIKRTIKSFLKGERYRYAPISSLYVYGRRQDIGFQKARGTVNERNHMRFWVSPIRFRGKNVFVGQISRDIGVKFTLKSPTISTHVIDPDVDEARRYFVEDMAYSQALSGIGYVKGVGAVTKEAPRMNLVGDPFYTDGLRTVLFFDPRPYSLSDIDLLEWEYPASQVAKVDTSVSPEKHGAINGTSVQERTLTSESNGIRVSAAVVGDEEAKEIFGIDLARKNIQPVWIEIDNNAERPIILLATAIDPEYFAPLEVAFAYHKSFSAKANAELSERLLKLNFPIRSKIDPGSSASGYIFTNWSKGLKVIDVDLLGDDFSQNFTFFAPNPDSSHGQDIIDRMETMFSASDLQNVESEAALRQALEQLPCCVSYENSGIAGEPLNVVVIGELDDFITAFVRRGYRYLLLTPRYFFGRAQDISAHKQSRGYTKTQAHAVRFWQTQIRYQGKPVWAVQTSNRLGGRFADKASSAKTLPLDPYVDEARIDLTQDLAYSQALIKIGHVKGAGQSLSAKADAPLKDIRYTTDGLRAVLVLVERPTSLSEIDFFDWERLAD
jgi:hypothetical protein